mgnify:FL=1
MNPLIATLALAPVLARGMNANPGADTSIVAGLHLDLGPIILVIDAILLGLAGLLACQAGIRPATPVFREAGAQNSAAPLEASLRKRSADERVSRKFVCRDTLATNCRNRPCGPERFRAAGQFIYLARFP